MLPEECEEVVVRWRYSTVNSAADCRERQIKRERRERGGREEGERRERGGREEGERRERGGREEGERREGGRDRKYMRTHLPGFRVLYIPALEDEN